MNQVLIVDDSKLMREMVAACLRHLVEFVFAARGGLHLWIEAGLGAISLPIDAMAEEIVRRV